MVYLHHNISNSCILLLLLWMYLHSATSPEKEVGGTGQMTWSKSPPLHQFRHSSHTCAPGHPRTTFFLIGRYDCGKDSPHRRQVSLVQFYVAASSVPFWSSLSPFSADENKATHRDAVPAELRSVSWPRDERLNLSTHCPPTVQCASSASPRHGPFTFISSPYLCHCVS